MLRGIRHRLFHWGSVPETSRLIVGSTGSGKSEGELLDLVRLADRREHAVVLLDGHGPLAFSAAGHWAARGYLSRLVYEPLDDTDRVLSWGMLPQSDAATTSRRRLDDAETADEVAQCFLAQRNLATLNDRPWTKEWLEAAVALCIAQPKEEPLPSLLHAFRVGSAEYERLLAACGEPEIVEKLRGMERLKRKSEVQYEVQTGPARRLLEAVCTSEVVRLRCRPGSFDWLVALREKRLVAFDGGGVRSTEIKRTLFLLVSMHVIHAVRRHFAETHLPLPVVLVLEEAGALGLVTPFVRAAVQELRKAGLSVRIITQSSLDFGDTDLFEALLANTPWQAWYQCLAPADQELGARALANATFDPYAVHFHRTRALPDGVRRLMNESRGESVDPVRGSVRRERRTAFSYLHGHRTLTDAYYKSPQLQEQEFRTQLATLLVGERWVRERASVRKERLRLLRPPWRLRASFAQFTRTAIEHVRRQPIYRDCTPYLQEAPLPPPDAPERLQGGR